MVPVEGFGVDSPVDATNQLVATAITVAITVIAVASVLVFCARKRMWWPLIVVTSGGATFLLEPLFDHLYGLWFFVDGQWNAVVTYGIHVPVWLPVVYVAYYGCGTILYWYRLERGAGMRDIAIYFTISILLAAAFEEFYINGMHLYAYQDHQPLVVFNYPVWLAIVNGVPPMLAGVVLYPLARLLQGWSKVTLLLLVPICFAANSFGSGFLYLAVRHSGPEPSMLLLSITALIDTAGSIGVIWAAARLAGVGGHRSPASAVGNRPIANSLT